MSDIVRETLHTIDNENVVEFSISEITNDADDDGVYCLTVIISMNGNILSKKRVCHITQILTLTYALSYIGNNLRGIAKDGNFEFDLFGLNFDEYIPLSRRQRAAWDE